jgi:hypothetical protein
MQETTLVLQKQEIIAFKSVESLAVLEVLRCIEQVTQSFLFSLVSQFEQERTTA